MEQTPTKESPLKHNNSGRQFHQRQTFYYSDAKADLGKTSINSSIAEKYSNAHTEHNFFHKNPKPYEVSNYLSQTESSNNKIIFESFKLLDSHSPRAAPARLKFAESHYISPAKPKLHWTPSPSRVAPSNRLIIQNASKFCQSVYPLELHLEKSYSFAYAKTKKLDFSMIHQPAYCRRLKRASSHRKFGYSYEDNSRVESLPPSSRKMGTGVESTQDGEYCLTIPDDSPDVGFRTLPPPKDFSLNTEFPQRVLESPIRWKHHTLQLGRQIKMLQGSSGLLANFSKNRPSIENYQEITDEFDEVKRQRQISRSAQNRQKKKTLHKTMTKVFLAIDKIRLRILDKHVVSLSRKSRVKWPLPSLGEDKANPKSRRWRRD